MKKKSFKIPFGQKEDRLYHISEVEKGLNCQCRCPVCNTPLVARKGNIISHHFAHHSNHNCQAETVLHKIGKMLLFKRIEDAINNDKVLPMKWKCLACPDTHHGNLLKLARSVLLEKNLGECRPDITLLKEDGSPVAIIEIVVSHRPDENVAKYCNTHNVTLVEYDIRNAKNLEEINDEEVLSPTRVHLCLRPRCPKCNNPLGREVIHVITVECWRCNSPMKIAIIDIDGYTFTSRGFSKKEKTAAEGLGVFLKYNYSQTVNGTYLANTCPTCKAFIGNHYMHEYSHLKSPENGKQIGWECMRCYYS